MQGVSPSRCRSPDSRNRAGGLHKLGEDVEAGEIFEVDACSLGDATQLVEVAFVGVFLGHEYVEVEEGVQGGFDVVVGCD